MSGPGTTRRELRKFARGLGLTALIAVFFAAVFAPLAVLRDPWQTGWAVTVIVVGFACLLGGVGVRNGN